MSRYPLGTRSTIYKEIDEIRKKFSDEEKRIVNFIKGTRYPIADSFTSPAKKKFKPDEKLPATPNQSISQLRSRLGEYTQERILPAMTHGVEDPKLIRDILLGLIKDDNIIQKFSLLDMEKDLDYVGDYNIGKYAEIYVSLNMVCPSCRIKSLKLFKNPNMPVIDLVCINSGHDIRVCPRLWQVKASSGESYFSRSNKFISVGSRNWGNVVHNITLLDDANCDLRIGYICLHVDEVNEFDKRVNLTKSFILFSPNNSYQYYPDKSVLDRGLYNRHEAIVWTGEEIDIAQYLDTITGFDSLNFNMNELISYIEEPISVAENTDPNIQGASTAAASASRVDHVGGEEGDSGDEEIIAILGGIQKIKLFSPISENSRENILQMTHSKQETYLRSPTPNITRDIPEAPVQLNQTDHILTFANPFPTEEEQIVEEESDDSERESIINEVEMDFQQSLSELRQDLEFVFNNTLSSKIIKLKPRKEFFDRIVSDLNFILTKERPSRDELFILQEILIMALSNLNTIIEILEDQNNQSDVQEVKSKIDEIEEILNIIEISINNNKFKKRKTENEQNAGYILNIKYMQI